ncbi:hypothetical protein, partial [Flavobacterium soyangense]
MKTFLRKSGIFAIVFVMANLFFSSAAFGQTVTTDLPDYPPGSTVLITGTGFLANETVNLQVIHILANGDNDTSGAHQPWSITADTNGDISSSWLVPLDQDELGATLYLTADGQSSLLHAEWMFTDAIHFQSVTVAAQATALFYGTSGSTTYPVTAGFNGSGSSVSATFSYAFSPTNPSGITTPSASHFSPNPVTSSAPSSTLSIATNGITPVGIYNFIVSGVGSDGNNAASNTRTLVITKATTSISAVSGSGIYGGSATLTATTNLNVAGILVSFNLDGTNLGSINTDAAGVATLVVPFASIPLTVKNAGIYVSKVTASILNSTNYSAGSGTGALTIKKAATVTIVTVAPGAPFTYTGSAIEQATVSVTGAGGLSLTPAPVYANNINVGTANASYS